MDCWNYSLKRILESSWKIFDYDEEKIFSINYPEVSLLPKIGKILLKEFNNVAIIHEEPELFKNIESQEEEEIADEYREELYNFISKGWKFWCNKIDIDFLTPILSEEIYCIIPIKKWEKDSHFVVLRKWENWIIDDNKLWEYEVNDEELADLIDLYNGKYVLLCS